MVMTCVRVVGRGSVLDTVMSSTRTEEAAAFVSAAILAVGDVPVVVD